MFIKYLLDNSVEWAKAGSIPAYNEARNSEEFKALPHAPIAPSAENPIFPPAIPGIGDAFAPLGEAVGAIMAGTETDIKSALDSSVERANEILAQNKATYGDAPKP
jgi:multiple sugar transport system substrate-binding protein